MSKVDPSTNPQIDHSAETHPGESEHKKLDREAEEMATKAGKVQSRHESGINDGAVSPGGGGIFSK